MAARAIEHPVTARLAVRRSATKPRQTNRSRFGATTRSLRLGVKGRSKMTKDELEKAVRRA
jgi:hypothetical protein